MNTTIARDHDVLVTLAVPGVHRVELDGATVGYVVEAGPVFVSLRGAVYNTSCEVGQALDLDTAVAAVLAS
ncbi:MAG TPA: hypothetical protein VNR36_01375 [Pseudolysinimonas sp.]|nr:hypothetical protein [Pseudolysinimonas sp.]